MTTDASRSDQPETLLRLVKQMSLCYGWAALGRSVTAYGMWGA